MTYAYDKSFDDFDAEEAVDFLRRRKQAIKIAEEKIAELQNDEIDYDTEVLDEQLEKIKQSLGSDALLNACERFRDLVGWVRIEYGSNSGDGAVPTSPDVSVLASIVGVLAGVLGVVLGVVLYFYWTESRTAAASGLLSWICRL